MPANWTWTEVRAPRGCPADGNPQVAFSLAQWVSRGGAARWHLQVAERREVPGLAERRVQYFWSIVLVA
jgi:hypothetical protein